MKIEIVKIIDRGIRNKERLWLKVKEDCDLVYYIINNTIRTSPNTLSSIPKNVYWFKSMKVKAGDSVVLYTCKGNYAIKENEDKSTYYFLYWGFENTLWNEKDDCAVVFEINSWQTTLDE